MNITFLIGNGFDIGLGMKSSFKDFFPIYKKSYKEKHGTLDGIAKAIDQNEDAWSYFEKQLGEYTTDFMSKDKNEFKDQVKNFELNFMKYLEKIEKEIDFSDKEKIASVIKSGLNDFYSSKNLPSASSSKLNGLFNVFNSENHVLNFICFNYTYCLEKCLKTIPEGVLKIRDYQGNRRTNKIGKVVHVHGFRDNNPIMGVNDVSQIKNQELSKDKSFIKRIVKPILNDAIRMDYDTKSTSLIDNSNVICIYGMSLGETDKKWWQKILNWLALNENRQLVIFSYDDKFETSSQFDYIDKEDDIIEKLASFSSKNNFDIEILRNRIHIAIHKNIFEMDLTNKKNAVAASTNVSPVIIA